MKNCRHRWSLVAGYLLAALVTSNLDAQEKSSDWAQFRGHGGQGASQDKNLPTTWSGTESVVWKIETLGSGTSSPVIVGSRIYLTSYTGYNVPGQPAGDMEQLKLHLLCLDRANGKQIWVADIAPKLPEQARIRDNHGYASSTPVVEGDRIYAFFGKTGVFAFDLEGRQLWQADVGSTLNGWGSANSPVLFKDLVIINASVESQSMVAVDKKTGKEIWRAKGINESWNTPILVAAEGDKIELAVAVQGKILGFDPSTGEQLWLCATDIGWYMVPSMVAADGIIYALGGRSGTAALAVRAGGRGDVTTTHRLWTSQKGSNVTSPVFHGGHLYWMSENRGIAYCAEGKTGKLVYERRIDRAGEVYASSILGDEKIYYVSRSGRTFVVAAKPEFELLATNELPGRSVFNASPAIAGGQIFLRSEQFLYCLGKK